MRVLHILNHSLPHTDGYAIRSDHILRFQKAAGLEVAALTSVHHEPEVSSSCEWISEIPHYRCVEPTRFQKAIVHELEAVRRVKQRIIEVAREFQPDWLHAHSPSLFGLAAVRASRKLRIPLVYEVRGIWEEGSVDQGRLTRQSLKYRLSRRLETYVARHADRLVVISQGLTEEFQQRCPNQDQIYVVPNGVEHERFRSLPDGESLRKQLGIPSDAPTFGYIGSLYRWEGVDLLIEAMPAILEAAPSAHLVVVGGGELAEELAQRTADLKLNERVHLVGKVPHQDVPHYYGLLDVLAYPRRRTRQMELVTPLKPLEAMAAGKAILGSDVGGIRELLPSLDECLFRAEDVQDLATKAIGLLGDPRQREVLGRQVREHVVNTRDWAKLIARYADVYDYSLKIPQSREAAACLVD